MGRIPRPPGWGGNQSPTCTKPQCCLEFGALLLPPCWALGAGAKDRPVGCASAPGSVTPEVVDVGASAKLLMQMFHLCDRSLPSTQLPLPRGPILPGLRLPTYAKVLLKSQPIQLLFLPPVFPSERACVRAPLSPGCPSPPPASPQPGAAGTAAGAGPEAPPGEGDDLAPASSGVSPAMPGFRHTLGLSKPSSVHLFCADKSPNTGNKLPLLRIHWPKGTHNLGRLQLECCSLRPSR